MKINTLKSKINQIIIELLEEKIKISPVVIIPKVKHVFLIILLLDSKKIITQNIVEIERKNPKYSLWVIKTSFTIAPSKIKSLKLKLVVVIILNNVAEEDINTPNINAKIKKDFLFVSGENDVGAPALAMEEMHHLTVNSKYACIPGVAHVFNLEKPEETNKILNDFLN